MKTEALERLIRILEAAVIAFTAERQINKAKEELSELHLELDRLAYDPSRTDRKKIITEIADVIITSLELAIIFGRGDVIREVIFKAERLNKRVDEELAKLDKKIKGQRHEQ